MGMSPAEVADAISTLRAFLDDVERVFPDAVAAQWERSPSAPQPRDEERGRVAGPISDPTYETVADERRLELRAEVRRHEAFLSWAAQGAGKLSGRLSSAVDAWEGVER